MTKIIESDRDDELRVRQFAKHMLKGSLFIGTFMEKRFVTSLNSYRDVVKISENETDLIDNVISVRKRLLKFYKNDVWIGITEPKTIGAPAGFNLWVSLDEEVFGSYWYKIKQVNFYNNEISIQLDIIRPVNENTPISSINCIQFINDFSQANVMDLGTICVNFFSTVLEVLFQNVTWSNLKQTTIFLFVLISTILTFSVEATKYLMEYFLKLLHEISGMIHVCTPIIINFMKLILNIVNGFYYLIAILWTQKSPSHKNNMYYSIGDENHRQHLKALPYRSNNYKSSVVITPLD